MGQNSSAEREPLVGSTHRQGSGLCGCFGSAESPIPERRTVRYSRTRPKEHPEHPTDVGPPDSSLAQRISQRQVLERSEQTEVDRLIDIINDEEKYRVERKECCLGGRLQKYWCVGSAQGMEGRILLTVAPLSKRCALNMKKDLPALNSLMAKLGKHPLLHQIHEIRCYGDKVVVIQPLMEPGSVRDFLHKVDPVLDWADKYGDKGRRRMKKDEIAQCGRSILEAILFLYDLGFPPVGHIQTGNIFKTPDGYKLGGYENTLLGYKSRYHHLCLAYGNDVDIIMLGHVIYEMASEGREFTSMVPEDDSNDYKHVKDSEVERVLKVIFSKVSTDYSDYQAAVQDLLHDKFFSLVPEGSVALGYDCELSGREKAILDEAAEGKERQRQQHVKTQTNQPDKEKSYDVMNYYISKRNYYYLTQTDHTALNGAHNLKSIGSRPGKFWGKAQKPGNKVQLLSTAKVSEHCPILLTPACVSTIRSFFETSCEHPNLLPLDDLKFYSGHVLMVQEYREEGSLKDLIYQTNPWSSWSEKIKQSHHGTVLTREQIQSYAKQILVACEYLYQLGFPQLGQIQSGNIFIEGDNLRLGGFENTLVGYSAVGSDRFQQYEGHMDRIMFGHVVYEMAAGTAVEGPIPAASDYSKISDKTVKKFTKEVFADVATGSASKPAPNAGVEWTKLQSHEFLCGVGSAPLEVDAVVPARMRDILKAARKGRAKKQRGLTLARATLKKAILQ